VIEDYDDSKLVKGFRLGLLGTAIVFVLLGGLVAAFGSGEERPEGVAERWLANVGDTRRDGVKERSRRDAEEVGPVALAAHLLPEGDTEGRSAFVDLEVGKASRDPDATTRVPFRLHQRIDGSAGDPIDGTIELVPDGDSWRIVGVDGPVEGRAVPSEGGRPAAEAPAGLFVGAIVVAFLVAAGCSVAVKAAGRAPEPARTGA
jgi:hypothetical protein